MAKPTIEVVWRKIAALEGETFHTTSGLEFQYRTAENTFFPSRTKYDISKSDFATVLEMAPLEGPGEVNNIVRGPSYIWAVLHDERIRGSDW